MEIGQCILPPEIVDFLFSLVNDGKTYKAILETCKYFYNGHKHRKSYFCNQLWTLIEKYPNKPWNWLSISQNPKITMELIEKHPEKPWNWVCIFNNPNLTLEFIEKHPERSEDWRRWHFISQNSNITMEIIEKHPEKPWDWCAISQNPNITMEFIEKDVELVRYFC
jgi:hypothetical protein